MESTQSNSLLAPLKKKSKKKKQTLSSSSSVTSTSSSKTTNKITVARLLKKTISYQSIHYHNQLQHAKVLEEESLNIKEGAIKKEHRLEPLPPIIPPMLTLTVSAEKIQKMQLFDEIHEQIKQQQMNLLNNSSNANFNLNNSDNLSLPSVSSLDPSLSSEFSSHSLRRVRTNKELVHEISRRAQKHQRPPEYVASLNALPPHLISWDGQAQYQMYNDASSYQSSASKVNIIGCMHPLELILSKADERIRKQQQNRESRDVIQQERVDKLNHQIELKKTRAERLRELLQFQQLQVQWMKIVMITKFFNNLNNKIKRKKNADGSWNKMINHYAIIQRLCVRWYRRHLQKKLHMDFLKGFHNARFVLEYHIYKFRKRRSADKIKVFLQEYKNHHKMTVVVHHFLIAVRKCQRIVRKFLDCKNGRISAMVRVWDKVEFQYIKKKLEKKRERMRESQLASKKISDSFALLTVLDDKAFLQMKYQAKIWSRIDQKMEDMIGSLRNTGVLYAEKEEVVISKLMVPMETKLKSLQQILEKARRDFFIRQRNLIRQKIDLDATFKEHHVRDLLQGRNENMTRILETKFGIRPAKLQFQPFHFFSALDRKIIFHKIKEIHNALETFKIKIDT